ncbi:hypothetical protein CAP48_01625 [Advenella sp. S44]|nr:hypothetical protein CAP48_01625 [Advenella sp. S44]
MHIDVNLKTSYFTLIRTKLSTGSPPVSKFPPIPPIRNKIEQLSGEFALLRVFSSSNVGGAGINRPQMSRGLTTETQILLKNPSKPLTNHKKFDEI